MRPAEQRPHARRHDLQPARNGAQHMYTPSDVTFQLNSAAIQPQFYGTLNDVAATLIDFPSTAVDIVGHASADGPADYNMDLSQRRAVSVSNYLTNQGLRPVRLSAVGMGETQPLPGISPEDPQNRRVEIVLTPIVEGGQQGYYN